MCWSEFRFLYLQSTLVVSLRQLVPGLLMSNPCQMETALGDVRMLFP
jgi:hypothetical protein